MSDTGKTIALIKALSGGGGLPEVTSADEGKVLAVNSNGEWDAESNLFVVTKTNVGDADKTYQEILDAYNAGKSVVLNYNSNTYMLSDVSGWMISFTRCVQNKSVIYKAAISSSNDFYANGASLLPPVKSSDAGKVLAVDNSGVWGAQEPIGKKFIVTLTPTSADYSGTMDKTPQEITAAYNAGQTITFVIPSLGTAFDAFEFVTAGTNVQAGSVLTYRTGSSHLLIECLTSSTDDDSTYMTHIYTLTPAT